MQQQLETAPAREVAGLPRLRPTREEQARLKSELRVQIARLEHELDELFATSFPRRGLDWGVPAAGGPRLLSAAELEQVRDRLVHRLAAVRGELGARADREEAYRGLAERMIADPAEHKWERVSNEDVGEAGCRHWHSRPRWGLLGMIAGWWRVKLSSGCPLAGGRPRRPPKR